MYYNKVEICGINTAKLPLLTDEAKRALLLRAQAGDLSARDELIYGNLRLVLSIIQRFSGRRESSDDLEVGGELFDGAPDSLKIHLYTDTSYHNFISGYWWAVHSGRMIKS